jgi:syringate O-demethylase
VLFNQSYHMADLAVEGPDAATLLSTSPSTASRASRRQGEALRALHAEGYVIGDVILFHLAEDRSTSSAARRH